MQAQDYPRNDLWDDHLFILLPRPKVRGVLSRHAARCPRPRAAGGGMAFRVVARGGGVGLGAGPLVGNSRRRMKGGPEPASAPPTAASIDRKIPPTNHQAACATNGLCAAWRTSLGKLCNFSLSLS